MVYRQNNWLTDNRWKQQSINEKLWPEFWSQWAQLIFAIISTGWFVGRWSTRFNSQWSLGTRRVFDGCVACYAWPLNLGNHLWLPRQFSPHQRSPQAAQIESGQWEIDEIKTIDDRAENCFLFCPKVSVRVSWRHEITHNTAIVVSFCAKIVFKYQTDAREWERNGKKFIRHGLLQSRCYWFRGILCFSTRKLQWNYNV